MEPKAQPKPTNPLREHALGFIRISGYMLAGAAILFLVLLPFTPHSAAYYLTAAAVGVASFPLLWRHWHRPNNFLFTATIMLVLLSRAFAERAFFPDLGSISWLLLLQFLSLYFVAEFALIYIFRHRLRESINQHSTVA
jgi:hypothetical protein